VAFLPAQSKKATAVVAKRGRSRELTGRKKERSSGRLHEVKRNHSAKFGIRAGASIPQVAFEQAKLNVVLPGMAVADPDNRGETSIAFQIFQTKELSNVRTRECEHCERGLPGNQRG
jgi:hypothetical protein